MTTADIQHTLGTIACLHAHQAHLMTNLLALPVAEQQVRDGFLGNCETIRTRIRLHKEAIKELVATL